MKSTIALVIFNEKTPVKWEYGEKIAIDSSVDALIEATKSISKINCTHVLYWNAAMPLPTKDVLDQVKNSKGNLWHIGSKNEINTPLNALDAIQPVSMLHLKISPTLSHSSWKVNLNGCLLESNILNYIGFNDSYKSIEAVGFDFGYRCLKSSVITRYSESLATKVASNYVTISKEDELKFIRNNFDKKAFVWSSVLSIFKINPFAIYKVYRSKVTEPQRLYPQATKECSETSIAKVSIVIATLDRYEVLNNELNELKQLKVKPHEIIIVDQTPLENRNTHFFADFSDLPIVYIESKSIGQCTARNIGIESASGDYIWFLDDDMEEIPSDYLQRHLNMIYSFQADVSCGVPDEIGTNYIDRSIPKIELSDGFPTNDVLVKKDLLVEVGGFDVKMDQQQSEDQEIGLRCIKAGALSLKNNQMRIVHLRAGKGGLRQHNVRKITFASSRNSLTQRRLPHQSEIYLNTKHFNALQVKKYLYLCVRGTFIIRGGVSLKIGKILTALFYLPNTLFVLKKRYNLAKGMFKS